MNIINQAKNMAKREQSKSKREVNLENNLKPESMITVFSPKGGVGTTTVALNLSICLHNLLKKDVLLIDGKHLFGHISLYCNLFTGNSISDLITRSGMLDKVLIEQVVEKHSSSGIHILPSPNSALEAQSIKPDDLFKVIKSIQEVYPYIIVDGGNTLNENAVTYMDSSDKILIVLRPDIASLRDVKQFIEISETLSYPKEKILFILNLTGNQAEVKKEEIEKILEVEIFGRIPSDYNAMLSCINEGVPIIQKKSRHPISKAFTNITEELIKSI